MSTTTTTPTTPAASRDTEPAGLSEGAAGADPGAELRSVARRLPTGVTVVTSGTGDAAHGMTVSSFTTLSLAPPLVSFSVRTGARIRGPIEATGAFVVNLLAAEQEPLARWFADPDRPTGAAGFHGGFPGGVRTAEAPGGGLLLSGAVGYFACRLDRLVEAGDHVIVIGAVERCRTLRPAGVPALVFADGGFHAPGPRLPG
ncbi:flavin reductase family protein [Streptomyces sp. NPDC085460]|uniref:flavin reductase family protein n=1 Tax=Streptomyces sp. NPDC085460 TaxID=3365723 RepID=UPI0037D8CED9